MKYLAILFVIIISLPSFALEYGADRLREPAVAEKLEGKALAVLTHAAGRTKDGEHLIDVLFRSFQLKKIFAPEHGLRTMSDEWVGDETDEATNLPVISLYKRGTRAPTATDLAGIDAIVIDLQDVGVRYYTYFATIAEVMKAAAPLNIEVILLDRPNLLGGTAEGKVLDESLSGKFTAYHTVPTRHGMTLGELARMINAEKKMNVKLTVIEVKGWHREELITTLDRPWIAPSPALIEISQVALYAMWGALESLNLSIGRGKTNELAFKVIGAPWMSVEQSKELSDKLNELGFKGVTFTPFSWAVTRAKYEGTTANGVRMNWDGSPVRTDEFVFKVASLLVKLFPDQIGLDQFAPASLGSVQMINAIRKGTTWFSIAQQIDEDLRIFIKRKSVFLLY